MRIALIGLAIAGLATGAEARCVLPEYVMRDGEEAARYILDREEVVIDGIVRELPRGDQSLFQRLEVRRYIKGKGPMAIDIWPGPGKPSTHTILDTEEWGRIDAPSGALVVTALRHTPYGWTVGECAYQALSVPGVEDVLRTDEWVSRFFKQREAEAKARSAAAGKAGGR